MTPTVASSGHVWILREEVEALKGNNKVPELAAALKQLDGDLQTQPFVYARVFPDSMARHDWRRVQIGAGKELPARTDVLVSANPEGGDQQCADVAQLSHLNEPALLRLVEQRYAEKNIYTRAGPVLVAMNPFENMEASLYGADQLSKYQGARCALAPAPRAGYELRLDVLSGLTHQSWRVQARGAAAAPRL